MIKLATFLIAGIAIAGGLIYFAPDRTPKEVPTEVPIGAVIPKEFTEVDIDKILSKVNFTAKEQITLRSILRNQPLNLNDFSSVQEMQSVIIKVMEKLGDDFQVLTEKDVKKRIKSKAKKFK
tara:strand:- start:1165 stop:1530 length:366 start_codon:yes stop_codon:yes gene_type:complete